MVEVDRNLLFGVIAMQRDLIEQAQFTEACSVWALRVQTPLAVLLIERGWITAEDRRDIERDIERKIKKHRGDVRASLAAVAGADARDAIRAVEHPEIRKSLSGLPPAVGHVLIETLVKPTEGRSRYTLTRLHGEGALGKVWVARDGDLNREVALKEIQPERAGNTDAWRRFLKEAQVTGQLEHPNIVPVYELGRRPEDEQPFYTMKLVRGQTLRDAIADAHQQRGQGPIDTLTLQKLLTAFVNICQAIGYAHSRGVIHRDLKPENVVLGGFGEVIVLDWGLAKMVDQPDEVDETPRVIVTEQAETEKTQGQVGTPAYMAPEQAEGRQDVIDGRTDIYGLGAILFEILTGRPPHDGKNIAELLTRIITGETPRVRAVDPAVPAALDAICAQAMAKARAGRYAKASDLAEDVQRWIADEPVSAWREPFRIRARRWVAKHRTLVTSAAAAVLVAVAAGGYILYDAQLRATQQAAQRLAEAKGRVEALATAEVRALPGILAQLGDDRRLVRDRLEAMARTAESEPNLLRRHLAAALARLPDDPSQADFLAERLLQAEAPPDELIVIRQALQDHGHAGTRGPRYRATLETAGTELTAPQLRAAGALALFDPKDARWPALGPAVAAKLVRENPLLIGAWREAFQPVHGALAGSLRATYGDRARPEERALAFTLLFEFATQPGNPSRPEDLAELVAEADPAPFHQLLELLRADRPRAIARLASRLETPARFDDVLARRQGRVATALVALGESERVWPLMTHREDPSVRTELIHDLGRFGVDSGVLIARLKSETEVSARRALILALGEFPRDRIPAWEREALATLFRQWYQDDPDPGVHGGIDWLLRQRWSLGAELDRIDQELAGPDLPKDREWYVNGQGQTLAVIRGPVEFRMGSPPESDAERETDDVPHLRRIDRSFAIATKEVSVAQYARFLNENPGVANFLEHPQFKQDFPSTDCAMGAVDWYDAVRYCNWLSQQEGIPEDQWCYSKEVGPEMKMSPDWLKRVGYRLPTEAEWEYACRAGAASARPYGGSEDLLPEYGWFLSNAKRQMHPAGQKKPNDLGLFDVLGNAYEWSHDAYDPYPTSPDGEPILDAGVDAVFSDNFVRVLRGCSFNYAATNLRSAVRNGDRPSNRNSSLGVRPARTYP